MAQNNTIGTKLKFQDLPSVPDNQKLTATEFNQLPAWDKSPVQQIAGSLDDTDIIIDGTKNYGTTIVETGATRTITVNASGHSQGNNIKQRYTFDVDCTLTLSGFDTPGNNTGDVTPIPAGTYDFQYFSNRNGVNVEIAQNTNVANFTEPNTWYLNTDGDNADVGSDKFPFKTIQAAHDAASPFDVIIIQNPDFVQPSSPATSITKDGLVIKGAAVNSSTLGGAWTLTAGVALRLQNLGMSTGFSIDSTGVFTLYVDSCSAKIKTGTSRYLYLIGQNSSITFGTPNNLYQLEAYNCRCTGDINVGRRITFNHSSLVGNSISGIDSVQPMSMRDSSIEGDATVTGDLDKVNSVITGTETVSGTTTSRQAKVFDDSVEFKDKVSIGVSAFLNLLDVAGGMVVGSGIAGIFTAPTDGLLVEGQFSVNEASPDAGVVAQIKTNTNSSVVFFNTTAGNNGVPVGSTGLGSSFSITRPTDGVALNTFFVINDNDTGFASRKNYHFFCNTLEKLTILDNGRIGIEQPVPVAKADINQSSETDAIPVLKLTQADLSEEMIKFDATIGTGNPIEAIGAKSFTQTHFLKINVEGLGVKYMPIGDLA